MIYLFMVVALVVVVVIFLLRSALIVPDTSCVAVVTLGRFTELVGPGFHIKWRGDETRWVMLTTGERGKLISDGIAKFQNIDIPVILSGVCETGDFVRIAKCSAAPVTVVRDNDQSRAVICEKCGHENIIR